MRLSPVLLATGLGAVAIAASALAFRVPHEADTNLDSGPLLVGARIDAETLRLVARSCQNCHSERTEWPWYSHLPPVSWALHRDVTQARDRLNLSRWADYTAVEKQALLSAIGAAVRTAEMPPSRYTLMHSESRLSRPEREQLYRWTRAERSRIRRDGPSGLTPGETGLRPPSGR